MTKGLAAALDRAVVRAARIVGGAVIFSLAWWLGSLVTSIFDTPLSALTLRDIGKAILFGWMTVMVAGAAFYVAFGPGPDSYD